MARSVWETTENNGDLVISDWDIPSEIAGKLESRLHLLRRAEVDAAGKVNLPHGALAGPNIYGQKWIYKLKVNGKQALRPMVCLGPSNKEREWTALARAREQDNDTSEQKSAAVTAASRRQQIIDGKRTRKILLDADDATS